MKVKHKNASFLIMTLCLIQNDLSPTKALFLLKSKYVNNQIPIIRQSIFIIAVDCCVWLRESC